MRLSECLNSSDVTTLQKIANSYQFDCSKSSKNALMQEILTHFNNRSFVADAYTGIKETTYRDALAQLMLDNRQEFSREEILAMVRRAGQTKEGADQKSMQRLLHEGWLYRLNSKGGRQFYFIPEDLRRTMREYLSENLKQQVEVAAMEPIVYRDENLAMVRDTTVFLDFVQKNDVRITKDGKIIKRTQQQLFTLFEIKEEVLGDVAWRFGYGRRFHDYPDRFALIYDYCYQRGLIEETPDGCLVLGTKAEAWKGQDEKERLQDIFRYWRLLYRRPIPRLKLCIATLAQAAKQDWIHVTSMNRLLSPYVGDYYYDKAQSVMEQRIYNMLVHQGLLAHGQLADATAVIKVTALGREILLDEEVTIEDAVPQEVERMPVIIQPNFDVLVPLETYAAIGWELDEVTDMIRVDTMRVHRITKSSVFRAFDQGWTGETAVEFFREESGGMLPGNVERMIQQWASEFGAVKMYRSVVVECTEEAMAADLKSMPEVAKHLRLELTKTHFLIDEAGIEVVQEALNKMGYHAEIIG